MQIEKAGTGIYVSAFLTNHVITETAYSEDLFDLRGVGFGYWRTDGDCVIVKASELFIAISWHESRRGAHKVQIELRTTEGTPVGPPFYKEHMELSSGTYYKSFSVSIDGLSVPRGCHLLWVTIDGELLAPTPMHVLGPGEGHSD